ncbi:MAG: glucokinase [Gammaproteobacteria bacterium]|nr:glucokinase [Gammaproteobacteria bacterium]
MLAGDIGATHARLGLFDAAGGDYRPVAQEKIPCRDASGIADLIGKFSRSNSRPFDRVCLAVAGPVEGGRATMTNLNWSLDAAGLAAQFGLVRADLLNDLEAVGYGLNALAASDLMTLDPGAPSARGNLAVIAAGTGLGECICYWDGTQHRPCAGEGGHTDFGPRNELERELLAFLSGRFPRVSYERVVSGPGLFEIYRFLQASGRGREPESLTEAILRAGDSEPVVSAALDGRSERCAQAARLLLSILAAEAGNLALKAMARGGVFLGGGMVSRLLPLLSGPEFMQVFADKEPMRGLLAAMPVHVILNDNVGLLGAVRYARLKTGSE